MSYIESKELTQAKKLIDISKLDEAEKLIKKFEEKGGHTLHDIVLCHLLKCELLGARGLYKDVIKLAEQAYKDSLGLGKNPLSIDVLLEKGMALLCLGQRDKAHDMIKEGEELLKTLTQELPGEYKQREAYIAFLKGWVCSGKLDVDQAIKQFELSLSLREDLDVKHEIAWSLYGIAHMYMYHRGDFDRALTCLERGMVFAEESGNKLCIGGILFYMAHLYRLKGDFDKSIMYGKRSLAIYNDLNNKFMITRTLNSLGENYIMKGELNRSIKYYEQSLELLKKLDNKPIISDVFNSLAFCYKMKGELNRAIECIEQSMTLTHELGTFNPYDHHFLIQILIDMDNFEGAKNSLRDFEQLTMQFKGNKIMNLFYLLDKALLLKTSSRALNRGKAEEILKQILEEQDLRYEINIEALLNLCELLLADLQLTNEMEVLEEIKPLITDLLDLSEKSQSFWVLGETYLLQAKLALISLNSDEARKLLSQGQKISEKYGLNQLAIKISNEHDQMLKQLEIWENFKESEASLSERIELSRLNEQMEGMVKRQIGKLPKLEAEQPILLTVMSKDGKILLSNPFTADMTIDSAFFSEFLSSCDTFCNQILSESFDRVKFGQHTVLITVVDSFSICYMFQGQSYTARQKLLHFS
ncbi:MAG: tetratricopeptide repeat protein, partial [Promethearchaeota archaeon]